ncbi:hypothetical protein N780_08440 [Pontibacillus chungwhensis BH030062]|uniref:Uncharacterized protein n=1 Tax=Pontibacillus chungwhensis BH030062 TaxID=1385513 RepID=A0A0A2USP3_9BACI|nr:MULTISPECIES: hypothetical protein [Pontibacillus]KGP91312.1 hypothetical protein N780_08440 [Pontibacillus chungwhensis BH030062]QST01016.1 hypothetical protein IMZ31_05450 [Pontibacillus sp. ALD_SL1]
MGVGLFTLVYLLLPQVVVFSLSILLRLYFRMLNVIHILIVSVLVTVGFLLFMDGLLAAIAFYIGSNILVSIFGILVAEFCFYIVHKAERKVAEKYNHT